MKREAIENMQKEFEEFVNGSPEHKFFEMLRFICKGMDVLTDLAESVDSSVFSSADQKATMNFYLLQAMGNIAFVTRVVMNHKKIKSSN